MKTRVLRDRTTPREANRQGRVFHTVVWVIALIVLIPASVFAQGRSLHTTSAFQANPSSTCLAFTPDAHTAALYHFDNDGASTTLVDASGNGHDGDVCVLDPERRDDVVPIEPRHVYVREDQIGATLSE